MPITREMSTLPTPPSRQRPATFSSEADAFLAALPDFADDINTVSSQMNTVAGEVNTNATTASDSAATATTQAVIASTSASNALTSANNADTSEANALSYAQSALDSKNAAEAAAATIDTNNLVYKTGDQTKSGILTFVDSPIVPTPTTNTQAANKAYVDTKQANLGFTPVQQGTGIGQIGNIAVKIGWSNAYRAKITVDDYDLGNIVMDNNIGVANSPLVKTALNASGTAPIYACRAWVNFNGFGAVAIRASGNVSSITDNGVGNYTVNFITAMPDVNYSISGFTARDLDTLGGWSINNTPSRMPTTNGVGFLVGSISQNYDTMYCAIQVFR